MENLIDKFQRKFSSLYKALSVFPKYSREFGFSPAITMLRRSVSLISVSKYINLMSDYVKNEIKCVTQLFIDGNLPHYNKIVLFDKKPIWVCWFQGRENLPDICRICISHLENNIPDDAKIIFLTKENYKEYIIFPDYINEKFENGFISNPHFSDLLRFGLLSIYGGVWVDAAILLTGNVLKKALNEDIYSVRFYEGNEELADASRGRWIGGFWAGTENIVTFKYCYECLLHLWRKHNLAIEYLTFDYIIWNGYIQVDSIKKEIDSIPVNNKNIRILNENLTETYSAELLQKILNENDVHLINRHKEYTQISSDGKLSIYGHLLKNGL